MEKNAQRGIAAKYRRVLITFIVSVVLIVIWKAIDSLFEEIVYWEIVGNIAAFGLWQAGYLYFEQLDLLEELFKSGSAGAQICAFSAENRRDES